MRLWIPIALTLFVAGCGSDAPFCGEYVDITGRAAAYCPGSRDDPVCDLPGERAHYEMGPMGLQLTDGARASCDADFEVVCPMGTVGPAYCITDPEL